MSKMLYGCALTIAAALAGSGCANAQSAQPAPPVSVASGNPDEVVATVGDKKITLKDVEAKWQERRPGRARSRHPARSISTAGRASTS